MVVATFFVSFPVAITFNACADYDGLDVNGNEDPDEIDEVNDFHKYIHFCCDDVGEEQRVVFMVCDDGDQDGIVEMNGDDNCTTSMIAHLN